MTRSPEGLRRRAEYTKAWKAKHRERVRKYQREYMRTWTPPIRRAAPADAAKREQLKADIANLQWQALHSASHN
jgi:hypothetical protein